jgi:hypothetical protein
MPQNKARENRILERRSTWQAYPFGYTGSSRFGSQAGGAKLFRFWSFNRPMNKKESNDSFRFGS